MLVLELVGVDEVDVLLVELVEVVEDVLVVELVDVEDVVLLLVELDVLVLDDVDVEVLLVVVVGGGKSEPSLPVRFTTVRSCT